MIAKDLALKIYSRFLATGVGFDVLGREIVGSWKGFTCIFY